MGSFISKSPGDNHISCFPAMLPARSTGCGERWAPASLGPGGPLVGSVRTTEQRPGHSTARDTPLLKQLAKPTTQQTQLKSPANSIKRADFWKRLDFAPENDI